MDHLNKWIDIRNLSRLQNVISTSSKIIENKVKLVNGVLESLFAEENIQLDIDSENHLNIPSSDKSKIDGMLRVRENLLSKTSKNYEKKENKTILTLTGNYYYYTNQYNDAITSYEKACKIDSSFIPPKLNLAFVISKLGKHEEAISHFESALMIEPSYFDSIQDDLPFLFLKGISLLKSGQTDESLSYFDRVLEIEPQFVEAISCKGIVLESLGNHHEAISYFDKALQIDPAHFDSLFNKGISLGELGYNQDSIFHYDKILSSSQNNSEVFYQKGCSLAKLEKYSEAIDCYNKALKLVPEYFDAIFQKSKSLFNLKKFDKSLACDEKALQVIPNHSGAITNKLKILLTLSRFSEALNFAEEALKTYSENPDILFYKGLTLAKLGNLK